MNGTLGMLIGSAGAVLCTLIIVGIIWWPLVATSTGTSERDDFMCPTFGGR